MALSQSLAKTENEYKYSFPDVYYKIDEMWIEPVRDEIRIGVRGYPNKFSRENGGIGIDKKVYTIKVSDLQFNGGTGDGIIAAGYEYLKTLPEFEKAKDV